VLGLPERPPEGERILWQGKPDWWALARDAMMVRGVAVWFVVLAAWRGIVAGPDAAILISIMGVVACLLLMAVAWAQAKATVYTLTTKRVAMRIGAALNVTLNIPYRWIGSADLAQRRDGTGTITLDLLGDTQFSYLVIWPHVRPWHLRKTQPALRAIPGAERIARLLAEHAAAEVPRTEAETLPTQPIAAE
ncbi:MAG: photosynthetic complex putative assembly protein PuhB, partial [Pseudomonadota bacterium]